MDRLLQSILRGNPNNPDSDLSNPANWFIDWVGGGPTKSGIAVNTEKALGLPAFWRALSLWSKTMGALPLQVLTRKGDKVIIDRNHPTYTLLHDKPNQFMTSYIWRMTSMIHVLGWGDSYSLIEFNGAIRPVSLMPWHPNDVDVKFDDNGKLWYIFRVNNGDNIIVDASNVIHIKGFSTDGIHGKSLVSALRENIGLGIAVQEFGASFYEKGARLDGVVEMPKPLTKSGLENFRKSWNETYSGTNANRIGILDNDMKYKTIGIPPEDSQYIETRKFSVTDIARITDIPPPLLYDLEKATFSNIEALVAQFVKFSLNPWTVNWEQELNDKLFFNSEKNRTFAQFNTEGLLRGDIKTRFESYQKAIQNGYMTPNAAAIKENLPTYPEGDRHYMPMNIQPVGTPIKTNGQGTKKDVELITN